MLASCNVFLKGSEGRMPRWFRKPRNDDETKQVAPARFVRKYIASTLPWPEDVLKEWPSVQSAFVANVAVRARMPRPPLGVDLHADSEDEVIVCEPDVDDVPVGPVVDAAPGDMWGIPGQRLWVPSEADVEAFGKVGGCSDLAEILRASIERNLEYWRWWTTPGYRCPPIGPEMFGLVLNA